MRQTILADQMLSKSPSPDQHDFIVRQWSMRRNQGGLVVR
jgi:hypothetical protein